MKFLFISASDLYGGANIMAYNQHSALIKKGIYFYRYLRRLRFAISKKTVFFR